MDNNKKNTSGYGTMFLVVILILLIEALVVQGGVEDGKLKMAADETNG